MKRELLELAHKFEFGKYAIGGWFWSEKIDGIRAFYDGGISRGMRASSVPYANVTKHGRFVEEVFATGLWTRYGQVIRAPDWFLDQLPHIPLDGELHCGRGKWQETSSIIKRHDADYRWQDVKYAVFNSPHLEVVFADSVINTTNFKKVFTDIVPWITGRLDILHRTPSALGMLRSFQAVNNVMKNQFPGYWHAQNLLPLGHTAAEQVVREECDRINDLGGEGLMLRNPNSFWSPTRNKNLLKVKMLSDAEGTVVGYKFAKPTDLEKSLTGIATNKLLGMMGSLRIKLESGLEFDLSGFTDAERVMIGTDGDETSVSYAEKHPGEEAPFWVMNPAFPRGARITFKFREMSDDGLPKEARYWRKNDRD